MFDLLFRNCYMPLFIYFIKCKGFSGSAFAIDLLVLYYFDFIPFRYLDLNWILEFTYLQCHHQMEVQLDIPPTRWRLGWAVVVGAYFHWLCAFGKSISVFYKEIEEIFKASTSEVSWLSSIAFAVMYAGGGTDEGLFFNFQWVDRSSVLSTFCS